MAGVSGWGEPIFQKETKMAKKLGKIPQHKKLAMTGKPYKKGGTAHEKAAPEKAYRHGGRVAKKGCK